MTKEEKPAGSGSYLCKFMKMVIVEDVVIVLPHEYPVKAEEVFIRKGWEATLMSTDMFSVIVRGGKIKCGHLVRIDKRPTGDDFHEPNDYRIEGRLLPIPLDALEAHPDQL